MKDTNSAITMLGTLGMVLAALAVAAVLAALSNRSAAQEWETCYTDAVAVAEDSQVLTQDFGEAVYDDLSSILLGGQSNEARMDRLGAEKRDLEARLTDVQGQCGG